MAGTDEVMTSAALCARYSDGGKLPEAEVKVSWGAEVRRLKVTPAPDLLVEDLKIEKKTHDKSLQRA